MKQDKVRIANKPMPPSLADSSDLSALRDPGWQSLEVDDLPAEMHDRSTAPRIPGSHSNMEKGEQAPGRRFDTNSGTLLVARFFSNVKAPFRMPRHNVGETFTVTGDIEGDGEVHVEGEVRGNICCISLVVGPKGRIAGDVAAKDVVVRGRVIGTVRTECLTLKSTSYVEGDIYHRSFNIEQGAFFEGKSRRCDDPMSTTQIRSTGSAA